MIALLAMLLLVPATSADGRIRIAPEDECVADVDFAAFRSELLDAIEERDPETLLALMSDDVTVSFGGERGRDDFARIWGLDRPDESEVWDQLADALALGCAMDGTMAAAPRFVSRLPEGAGAYDTLIAVDPGAVLRAEPRADAEAVTGLDWDLMWAGAWDETLGDWLAVSLPDGRRGYVHAAQVRSPVDYRAFFEKDGDEWRITGFVAGD